MSRLRSWGLAAMLVGAAGGGCGLEGDALLVEGQATELSCVADGDGDRVCDEQDNCPEVPNEDQADFDDDGAGDLCAPPGWVDGGDDADPPAD